MNSQDIRGLGGGKVAPSSTRSWEEVADSSLPEEYLGESWRVFQQLYELKSELGCPGVYLPWALIGLTSATMAPQCFVRPSRARGPISLSSGIILTGRSGLGQSAVIDYVESLIDRLGVKKGPTDSGGQRPGLIAALHPRNVRKRALDELSDFEIPASIADFASVDMDSIPEALSAHRPGMVLLTEDVGRILQSHGREVHDFIYDGLRGRTMFYRTKLESTYIPLPSITLVAGSTIDTLRRVFPFDGTQINLLARLILVYSSKRGKPITWFERKQSSQADDVADMLFERLVEARSNVVGELRLSPNALKAYNIRKTASCQSMNIYVDSYNLIRQEHLIRTAALIALLRDPKTTQIEVSDINTADFLLGGIEENLNLAITGVTAGTEGKSMIIANEIYSMALDENAGMLSYESVVLSLTMAGVKHLEARKILDNFNSTQQFGVDSQNRYGPIDGGEKLTMYVILRRIEATIHALEKSSD